MNFKGLIEKFSFAGDRSQSSVKEYSTFCKIQILVQRILMQLLIKMGNHVCKVYKMFETTGYRSEFKKSVLLQRTS